MNRIVMVYKTRFRIACYLRRLVLFALVGIQCTMWLQHTAPLYSRVSLHFLVAKAQAASCLSATRFYNRTNASLDSISTEIPANWSTSKTDTLASYNVRGDSRSNTTQTDSSRYVGVSNLKHIEPYNTTQPTKTTKHLLRVLVRRLKSFLPSTQNCTRKQDVANVTLRNYDDRRIGVVLVNLGSPAAARYFPVFLYLQAFLSDTRVIELPWLLWRILLYAVVLPFRSRASALRYSRIMTIGDSPLIMFMDSLRGKVEERLSTLIPNDNVKVVIGMRYGDPSIASALRKLQALGIRQILIFPLYPQPATSSTSTVYDAVFDELKQWRAMPNLRIISGYADHPKYIKALIKTVKQFWAHFNRGDKFLVSFHGIPANLLVKGEVYYYNCQKTTNLLIDGLQLEEDRHILVFQSRFGRAEWLQPYLDEELKAIATDNPNSTVDIICPGFSCDCLETLDEIDYEYNEIFKALTNNNGKLRRISCLNDSEEAVDLVCEIIKENTGDWIKNI